jgi:hypothetical protein
VLRSPSAAIHRTVAITPSKSAMYEFDEVRRICQTCTLVGLQTMYDAKPAKPFRFIYLSGVAAERDQTKTPSFKPEYSKMRVSVSVTQYLTPES